VTIGCRDKAPSYAVAEERDGGGMPADGHRQRVTGVGTSVVWALKPTFGRSLPFSEKAWAGRLLRRGDRTFRPFKHSVLMLAQKRLIISD
jgi:hypothetical protein